MWINLTNRSVSMCRMVAYLLCYSSTSKIKLNFEKSPSLLLVRTRQGSAHLLLFVNINNIDVGTYCLSSQIKASYQRIKYCRMAFINDIFVNDINDLN